MCENRYFVIPVNILTPVCMRPVFLGRTTTEEIDFPEEEECHLLKEIISLWVTVRGFSLAATWLKTYKQSASKKLRA